jgi:uncharacterized protein
MAMAVTTIASVIWRRLDTPGHDACRLKGSDTGWQVEGTAVFRHEEVPAQLAYRVTCDLAWRTKQGQVHGWLGVQSIEFNINRMTGGMWTLNSAAIWGLGNCVDLDFGFTPATNLLQLRRLALAPGQAADSQVAWLDVTAGTLEVLNQRYERRTEATYWYEAPKFDYAAMIEVTSAGFIHRYPGLWEAES